MLFHDYVIQYGTPSLVTRDGIKWVTHATVGALNKRVALDAARSDAQKLRAWHTRVRIQRNGVTVR